MTLTQLTGFLAAARCGSFTKAAAELALSQPAVSELVRRLEEELGADMFHRSPAGLVLTEAGRQLLPHADQAVASAAAGAVAVRGNRELTGGVATFGVLRNADYYLGADLALTFHTRHPAVRIRLVGQNSAETAADVAAGILEAGLITLPTSEPGLDIVPIARDELFYTTTDPAAAGSPVTVEELTARPLVLYDAHHAATDPARRQLHERAQLAGRTIEPVIEVEYLTGALSLVAAGVGDTIVCAAAVASGALSAGVHTRPFDPPMYDTLAFVKRRGMTLSPASREMALIAWQALQDFAPSVELTSHPDRLPAFLSGAPRVAS